MALIQYFVLEQFNAFKRYALKYQFFFFPSSTPQKINAIVWLAGWFFVLASLMFFTCWILVWSVQSGTAAFSSWGINFTLQIAQDVVVIQVAKVYVLYVLAMFSIRPQLNFIYRTLNKIAIAYAQDEPVDNVHEFRVVQHTSPACRAARLHAADGLASAKILQQVDDLDIEVCHLHNRKRLMMLAFMMLFVPAALSILSVTMGELVLESAVPTVFSGFILANYYLSVASLPALIAMYVFIVWFYIWKSSLLSETIHTVKQAVKHKGRSLEHWHTARRAASNKSMFAFTWYLVTRLYKQCKAALTTLLSPWTLFQTRRKENKAMDAVWMNMNKHADLTFSGQRQPTPTSASRSVNSTFKSNMAKSPSTRKTQCTFHAGHWGVNLEGEGESEKSLYRLAPNEHIPSAVQNMLVKRRVKDWELSDVGKASTGREVQNASYVQGLMSSSLASLNQNSTEEGASDMEARNAAAAAKIRTPMLRAVLYQELHEITSDPHNALRRMLQKHVGKTHHLSVEHSQVDEYLSFISQYDHYSAKVPCDTITDIMKEIFFIFTPSGHKLSDEELNEVMELYYMWVLETDIDGTKVPFEVFEHWFLRLCARIVNAFDGHTDFSVGRNPGNSGPRAAEGKPVDLCTM